MIQQLASAFLILLLYSGASVANEPKAILVAGTEISGLLELEGTGPYHQVFQALTSDYKLPIQLNVTPMRRATRTFVSGQADCIFSGSDTPGYYEQLGLTEELILSDSIYLIRTKIYSRKGSPTVETISDLRGKFIAVDISIGGVEFTVRRMGHDITKALTASSLADGFDMLDSGRIAGFVAIDNDVKYLIAQNARYEGYSVSSEFSVNIGSDLVVCRRTEATEHFITHINSKIAEMTAEGTIEAIMRDALVAVRSAQ